MGSSSLLPMGFTPRVRSTARLSERDKGVEHFRVRTIGFPDQGVWIMPQIDHTGFAVAAARAILPDLVEHFAEIPADRIDVQPQYLHPTSQKLVDFIGRRGISNRTTVVDFHKGPPWFRSFTPHLTRILGPLKRPAWATSILIQYLFHRTPAMW